MKANFISLCLLSSLMSGSNITLAEMNCYLLFAFSDDAWNKQKPAL